MKTVRDLLSIQLAGLVLMSPAASRGQESPAAPSKEKELERKTKEVQRLQDELARAKGELEQLRKQNDQLRREKEAPEPAAQSPPPPSRTMQDIPLVGEGEQIELTHLLHYFETDPAGAETKFKGKRFEIRGVIEGFSPMMFRRAYEVRLGSPERKVIAVCSFGYAGNFKSVFTTRAGQELVAKTSSGPEVPLLKTGDTITVSGVCQGRTESHIEFGQCRLSKKAAQR